MASYVGSSVVVRRMGNLIGGLSLARQFLLLGSALVLLGLGVVGFWVSSKIERIVMDDVGRRAASYIQSVVSPHLRDIPLDRPLPASVIDALNRSVDLDPVGMGVREIKVWSLDGRILFDTEPSHIGDVYPLSREIRTAIDGEIVIDFEEWLRGAPLPRDPDGPKDDHSLTVLEAHAIALLETYVPIRQPPTGKIVAIGEFYQDAKQVRAELHRARLQSWAVTGAVSLGLIAGLYTVVARGSRLIDAQRADLDRRVKELTQLLSHNEDLRRHVKSATHRSARDTEAHLRRIGSDLHDGVGQLIAIVTLKLSALFRDNDIALEDYTLVNQTLEEAMTEIRDMAAGLALPEIEALSLRDAIALIVTRHMKRTQSDVSLEHSGDEAEVAQPLKLSACRFVQEALNNAYKHAGGCDQAVSTHSQSGVLTITVSDGGPGIAAPVSSGRRQTLGLAGLRNRLESLGGSLDLSNRPGGGAMVTATFLLDHPEGV